MNNVLRFEITDKCNQRCKMCWSLNWNHQELEWDTIKKTLEEFAVLSPKGIVVLTSREPLISDNFEKVLLLATSLGLDIKILTNGTLLDNKKCLDIIKSNVSFVGISLHGNKNFHNLIVNIKDGYKRTLLGLTNLAKYKKKYDKNNLEIRITTVIHENLIESLDTVIDNAYRYGACLRLQHFMWHPTNIKKIHRLDIKQKFDYEDDIIEGFPSSVNISGQEVLNLIKRAKELCDNKKIDLQIYPDMSDEEVLSWYNDKKLETSRKFCDHVGTSIRLRANGDVSLCQYIDKSFGNIRENSLKHIIYENKLYQKISTDLANGKLFPICERCCHARSVFKETENKGNKKI